MRTLTADDLIAFATTIEHVPLVTLARKVSFKLRVVPEGIEFTPESSGQSRVVSRDIVQRLCDEFTISRSFRPGEYASVSFDASYLLALIDGFERAQNGARP